MRTNLSVAVLCGFALCLGCGETRMGEDFGPDPMGVYDPLPPGTQACGLTPPALLAPVQGQTLSGTVQLKSPRVQGPCDATASTVFTVMRVSGEVVFRSCSMEAPAQASWDTRKTGNGLYWVTAQSACSCTSVCTEYEGVRVAVSN